MIRIAFYDTKPYDRVWFDKLKQAYGFEFKYYENKLNKYLNAGVREYWMIDPMKKKVIVYDFEHEEYPVIYGYNDAKT